MITDIGRQWFTAEVEKTPTRVLATLWSVPEAKAAMLQAGIDTPTQAQLKLLHMQSRACPPWNLVWEVVAREPVLSGWERGIRQAVVAAHPGKGKDVYAKIIEVLESRVTGWMSSIRSRGHGGDSVTANDLRRLLLAAYGQPCPWLKAPMTLTGGIQLDHVTPVAAGGRSTLDNLQIISARANRMKGDVLPDDFRRFIDLWFTMATRSRASLSRRLCSKPITAYEAEKIRTKMREVAE